MNWTHYAMYRTLLDVGLTPAKSLIIPALTLPVDDHGLSYFWLVFRGVFDGDGSVILSADGNVNQARVAGGSPPFLRWLQKELHRRGVYETSIIPNSKKKGAHNQILVIAGHHVPLLYRRMLLDWDGYRGFARLGHPEKRRRMELRLLNVAARPYVAKMRRTKPKIVSSLLYCETVLGRPPNSTEYQRVRELVYRRLADPRDFPGYDVLLRHFKSWQAALAYLEQERAGAAPLPVPGDLPEAADILRSRGARPENRQELADRVAAIKRAKTLPKIVAAYRYCESLLGRCPNSGEYKRIRSLVVDRLEDKSLFPTAGTIQRFHFRHWPELKEYVAGIEPGEPLAVPGPAPPLEAVLQRSVGPHPATTPKTGVKPWQIAPCAARRGPR